MTPNEKLGSLNVCSEETLNSNICDNSAITSEIEKSAAKEPANRIRCSIFIWKQNVNPNNVITIRTKRRTLMETNQITPLNTIVDMRSVIKKYDLRFAFAKV